jgi:Methyltransferase domain
MSIKKVIQGFMPPPLFRSIWRYREKRNIAGRGDLTTQQLFSQIYEKGVWGKSADPAQPFFSGSGSHSDIAASIYVNAVRELLKTFDEQPNVVDLGCGDFSIGQRIRPLCANYIACDIVPKLISFNQEKFKQLNVDFRVLDLTEDVLPAADIVFIRQVLQHLSNDQVKKTIPKIASGYKFLVLTEHLPKSKDFQPNLDKPAGPGIRLGIQSGLDITKPPFNLRVRGARVLCEAPEISGLLRTVVYTL